MLVAKQVAKVHPFPEDVWHGATVAVKMVPKSVMVAAHTKAVEAATRMFEATTKGMSQEEIKAFIESARSSASDESKNPDAASGDDSSEAISPLDGPTFEDWLPGHLGVDVETLVQGSFVEVTDEAGNKHNPSPVVEAVDSATYDFIAKCATWENRQRPLSKKS